MSKINSITQRKEYGHINSKLKQQLDARNMSRNQLARSIDTRFEVVDKWYKNKVEKIDVAVLARICFALDCEIQDVFEYCKD